MREREIPFHFLFIPLLKAFFRSQFVYFIYIFYFYLFIFLPDLLILSQNFIYIFHSDAYAALRLLATSPLVDDERIGVMGFSYGGMAARLAMDARIRDALAPDVPPFSLHIDVYGPCFQDLQSTALTGAPILTLRGTEDASNDLVACARREAELAALGAEVTARVYQGAGHAWENEQPRFFSEDSPYLAGCELVYDERGRALLDGEPLMDYPLDASHATKMAARFSSGLKFRDCVGYGYLIGRDENARRQGYADIGAFVAGVWGLAGG